MDFAGYRIYSGHEESRGRTNRRSAKTASTRTTQPTEKGMINLKKLQLKLEPRGDITKLHCLTLCYLQNIIAVVLFLQAQYYLRNKSWDTRVAAAQSITAIAKNVKQWEPLFQLREGGSEDDNGNTSCYVSYCS